MARSYEMTVIVRRVDPACMEAVKEAAESCWDFEAWFPLASADGQQASGYGNLCGGESEREFADRLAQEIWAANGGYCEVEVRALCVDDLPYETYSFDEDDFEQLTTQTPTATDDSPPTGDP
jgi:hypothetical protein